METNRAYLQERQLWPWLMREHRILHEMIQSAHTMFQQRMETMLEALMFGEPDPPDWDWRNHGLDAFGNADDWIPPY